MMLAVAPGSRFASQDTSAAPYVSPDPDGTVHELRDRQLAQSLGLPLWQPATLPLPRLLLAYNDSILELRLPPPARTGAVAVDFASAALKWRLHGADLLLKAVRGRSRGPLRVADATAGLGSDSYALAARGYEVLMIERAPVVAALLANGLERGRASVDTLVADACKRLTLCPGDARVELQQGRERSRTHGEQSGPWDVVYLDPMFPGRERHALAKKEMQILQQLVDPPVPEAELLAAARAAARLRVVVKRPRKSAPLAGQPPSHQLMGRAVRFDVYVN